MKENYEKMKPSKANRKKFDIDLEKGELGENLLANILGHDAKLEVKSEQGRWMTTGNICIEFESYGKPSGIEVTEADYWVQNLMVEGNHYASIIIPTKNLKKLVNELDEFKWVKGGDNFMSKMWLVNLKKLFTTDVLKKFLKKP